MTSTPARSARFSFVAKIAAALALIALADFLFYAREPGWTLGLFALGWTAAAFAAVPALRRLPILPWLGTAATFGLILIEAPGLLAWCLFWLSLSVAVLLPRLGPIEHALRMAVRLGVHWVSSAVSAPADALTLAGLKRKRRGSVQRAVAVAALPLAGGLLFVALFASANPLIENAFATLSLPEFHPGRPVFWVLVLLAVWPSLRPRKLVTARWQSTADFALELPGAGVASVTLSLILFNAIFAVQNALDIAFLWSGAPLPDGVTLAEYAHRGAYPLILTALLAGFFVLVTMRPGSATAARPLIRGLVLAWIAQNLLLVASSILRTADYIQVYMLTELRIAALLWMGLVAVGLVLICWRLLRGRSAAWLINANAAAALAVLAPATLVDLGAIAAQWNVRHAREAGGPAAPIDLCYLDRLGPAALLPLIELERRPLAPELRDRLRWVRADTLARLERQQADWRQWSFRDARRLEAARAALGPRPAQPSRAPHGRGCGGERLAPPPPPPPEVHFDPQTRPPPAPFAPPSLTEKDPQ